MDSRTYSIQARSVPLLQRQDLALLSGTASPESDTAVRRTRTSTYATEVPAREQREAQDGQRRRRVRESRTDAEPERRRSRAERGDSEWPRRERRSEPLRESVSAHIGESTVVSVSRRSERGSSGRLSGFTLVPEAPERPVAPEPRVSEPTFERRRRRTEAPPFEYGQPAYRTASPASEFGQPAYPYEREAYPYEETYPFADFDAGDAYGWRDERATRANRLSYAEDEWSAPRGISGSQRRREAVREGLMTVPRAAASLGDLALRHVHVAAVLLVTLAACLMLYAPLRDLYIAHRKLDYLQATYAALEAENKDLDHQLAVLQTREGIENEARARGFVEAGETKVIVEGLPDDQVSTPTTASSLTEVEVVEDLPWYIEALDSFFVYEPED